MATSVDFTVNKLKEEEEEKNPKYVHYLVRQVEERIKCLPKGGNIVSQIPLHERFGLIEHGYYLSASVYRDAPPLRREVYAVDRPVFDEPSRIRPTPKISTAVDRQRDAIAIWQSIGADVDEC